jgi:hypothetical protein
LPEGPTPAAGDFVVVEALAAASAGRMPLEIEAAALRVSAGGLPGESFSLPIRPDPWPRGFVPPEPLRGRLHSAETRQAAVERVARFAEGAVIVCFRRVPLVADVGRRLIWAGRTAPVLQLQRLARQAFGRDAARSREALAGTLGGTDREIATAEDAARATAKALAAFLGRGMDADDMLAGQHPERRQVDFERFAFGRDELAGLPEKPGVYVLRDAAGRPVYVGKARNLRQRVADYFRSRVERDTRVEAILERAHSLETREAGSELEALLMERRAIVELSPDANVQSDVHGRPTARRGERRRVIAVMPSVRPRCAELFMVRGVEGLRQARYSASRAADLAAEVRRFFSDRGEGDPDEARLFWSWFAQRRDEARLVDVDAAAGPEDAARLVLELIRDIRRGDAPAFRV